MVENNLEESSINKKIVRVCVAIPNEGHTHVEAYANRLANFLEMGRLEERGKINEDKVRFRFFFMTMGRILTPLAREEAAKKTLELDFDYLFMIDDDMMCPDDLFLSLYKHDVDIVAPLAFTRNAPYRAVMYSIKEGWDAMTRQSYFINHWVDKYPKNQLVECDAVGFGAVLIKASVLKGMEKPWFMNTAPTGEDIYFCHKAKKSGYRVFMDTATKLGHLSHPVQVTEEYAEHMHKILGFDGKEKSKEYDKYKPLVLLGDKY